MRLWMVYLGGKYNYQRFTGNSLLRKLNEGRISYLWNIHITVTVPLCILPSSEVIQIFRQAFWTSSWCHQSQVLVMLTLPRLRPIIEIAAKTIILSAHIKADKIERIWCLDHTLLLSPRIIDTRYLEERILCQSRQFIYTSLFMYSVSFRPQFLCECWIIRAVEKTMGLSFTVR